MCYNCGCWMPNNDMGNPKNITSKTFEEAAKAMGQSAKDAKNNAHELLRKSSPRRKKARTKLEAVMQHRGVKPAHVSGFSLALSFG